jgi:hypothetical protein
MSTKAGELHLGSVRLIPPGEIGNHDHPAEHCSREQYNEHLPGAEFRFEVAFDAPG